MEPLAAGADRHCRLSTVGPRRPALHSRANAAPRR
jgi:hypothetical protein